MSLVSSIKGRVGEMRGSLAAKIRLDSQIYRSINNVTIPTTNGTTQIDHVIVSKFGIFVVEAKNIKGWIYGDEKQALLFTPEGMKTTVVSSHPPKPLLIFSPASYELTGRT